MNSPEKSEKSWRPTPKITAWAMRLIPLLAACSAEEQKSPDGQLDYIVSAVSAAVTDIAEHLEKDNPAPRRDYADGMISRFKNNAREWAITRDCTKDKEKKGMSGTECVDFVSNAEISFASANGRSGVMTASRYTAQPRNGRYENVHIAAESGQQLRMAVLEQHCSQAKDSKGGNDIHCETNSHLIVETPADEQCTVNGKSVRRAQVCRGIIDDFANQIRRLVLAEDQQQ